MAAEILWAMLTARALQTGGHSDHGFGGLTPDDVRGALQGMRPGPFAAGMVIRCGDLDSLSPLRLHLWTAIRRQSISRGWQAHKTTTRGRMDVLLSNLVILETCVGKRCPACRGNGLIEVDVQPQACILCSQRGRIKLLEKDKAEYCDMTRENWSRFWSRRYTDCFGIMNDWLNTADSQVSRLTRDVVLVA
jgi:hypothetical protein